MDCGRWKLRMTFVKQPDAGGDTMTLLKVDNSLYPPFSADVINGLTSLEIREDDIIICAYPKAGTHWVWEISRCLLAGTTTLPLVEKDNNMIECVPSATLDALPSPRILNTHLTFDQLPAEIRQKRCQIIYINRNPKDLAVSCYHHHRKLTDFYQYEGSWENFLPLFMDGKLDYGSWFAYVTDWERVVRENPGLPIHVMAYEDLKQDPVQQIAGLGKFLGQEVSEQFATSVADKCSFVNMKSRKGQFETGSDGEPIMYRKGEVGDWTNWFTVLQNEAMDGYLRQHLAESSLKFKYTLGSDLMGVNDRDVIIDANMN
ncbi:sulfotransferase 6B1, partial [Aplysia californica]|uniref:Sulfotransferase 6B1 n=1 Tax=Aplysia californica TaxID=6500 RepID=A0ABM0JVE2_APLCA